MRRKKLLTVRSDNKSFLTFLFVYDVNRTYSLVEGRPYSNADKPNQG